MKPKVAVAVILATFLQLCASHLVNTDTIKHARHVADWQVCTSVTDAQEHKVWQVSNLTCCMYACSQATVAALQDGLYHFEGSAMPSDQVRSPEVMVPQVGECAMIPYNTTFNKYHTTIHQA